MSLKFLQKGIPELPPAWNWSFQKCAEPPQGEVSQTGGEDSTVQVIDVAPYWHSLDEVSEMSCRVRGAIIGDEPRDTKLFGNSSVTELSLSPSWQSCRAAELILLPRREWSRSGQTQLTLLPKLSIILVLWDCFHTAIIVIQLVVGWLRFMSIAHPLLDRQEWKTWITEPQSAEL